ncbi:regulator of g protein signaling [Anaeramoeba flamelloides]|uniref:Regulator of g protein signaling n=1 Tax=Anaeramoeba flamelloides TaxID=1746091 RepID=A0AAV7YJA3_9EUKA|nr:regulator of g protein signaling [Anaeramoeba flamelloides]
MVNFNKSDRKTTYETEIEDRNETDNENGEYYFNYLNLDVKIREVERKFFQKKSRLSEKFMFKCLSIQFLFYNTFFLVIYYNSELKKNKNCKNAKVDWTFVVNVVLMILNVSILLLSTFLIRKIKDNYKIKNEINLTILLMCIFLIFAWLPYMSKDINYHIRWPVLIFAFLQLFLTYGYPLYWSFRFQKNQNKINVNSNNKKKSNNDNDNGNGNDDDDDDDNDNDNDNDNYNDNDNENDNEQNTDFLNDSFQKFINIIEDQEKVHYWILYSKKNYSVENIFFYKTIKSYQNFLNRTKRKIKKKNLHKENKNIKLNKIKNRKFMQQKKNLIDQIVKNFIEENSPLVINISSETRGRIKEIYSNHLNNDDQQKNLIPDDIFDAALQEITHLMFIDTWPQFIESPLYFEMIIKIEQINPDQYLNKNNADGDGSTNDGYQKTNKFKNVYHTDHDIEIETFNSNLKMKNSISIKSIYSKTTSD